MALRLEKDCVGELAYSIYVDDELLETVEADDALEYLHGHDNIIPGLEAELAGKQVGDKFDITVNADDAYGEYDPDLIEEIPRAEFDFDEEEMELTVGMEVEMLDEDGDIVEGIIADIRGDIVLVDLNPPLAGKSVRYVGEVINIREADEQELEWGFPESLLEELYGDDDEILDDED